VQHGLDMVWTSRPERARWERDRERWPPFASFCLAATTSAVLWAMIIQGVQRILQLV